MDDHNRHRLFLKLLTEDTYQCAWRYSWRLAENREDAEDLLQESLAYAFEKIFSLREREAFRGWLLSIVRTKYIRHWHRKKRAPRQADELPANSPAPSTRNPAGDVLAGALARLPESQREILGLYYIDGLSLQETGQVLGIKPGVVKQRLFRARGALRRYFQPQLALMDMSALF